MSEFNVCYMNDGSVGGTLEDVRHDLGIVQWVGSSLGLHLNHQKSKMICTNPVTTNPILSAVPGAMVLLPYYDPLLGTLLPSLLLSIARFVILPLWAIDFMHDSLLLCNSYAISKLLYIIGSLLNFLFSSLQK